MPASDNTTDPQDAIDGDLEALAAALMRAIAAEPVPKGIADAARELQQALVAARKNKTQGGADAPDTPL